ADTIEDDAGLAGPLKAPLLHAFAALFDPGLPPETRAAMSAAFVRLLPDAWRDSEEWEKILLARAPAMLAAFSAFPAPAREAIAGCVREMCAGMAGFALRQEEAGRGG